MSLTSRTLELALALLLIPLSSHTSIKAVVAKSLSECTILDWNRTDVFPSVDANHQV
jgi:hypothetical protein